MNSESVRFLNQARYCWFTVSSTLTGNPVLEGPRFDLGAWTAYPEGVLYIVDNWTGSWKKTGHWTGNTWVVDVETVQPLVKLDGWWHTEPAPLAVDIVCELDIVNCNQPETDTIIGHLDEDEMLIESESGNDSGWTSETIERWLPLCVLRKLLAGVEKEQEICAADWRQTIGALEQTLKEKK